VYLGFEGGDEGRAVRRLDRQMLSGHVIANGYQADPADLL
jgi:hypothetical protein